MYVVYIIVYIILYVNKDRILLLSIQSILSKSVLNTKSTGTQVTTT